MLRRNRLEAGRLEKGFVGEGCQPSRISPREGWQPSQRLFKNVAKFNKRLVLKACH